MTQTDQLIERVEAAQETLARQFLQEDLCAVVDTSLTMQQVKLMTILYSTTAISGQNLAGRLGVSMPTVSGMVDRLLERDMVRRFPSADDRRVRLLALTTAGEDLISAFHELGWRLGREVMGRMSQEDLAALAQGLTAMAAAARGAHSTQTPEPRASGGERLQPEAGQGNNDPQQGS